VIALDPQLTFNQLLLDMHVRGANVLKMWEVALLPFEVHENEILFGHPRWSLER
jgi:hypothetical protein